MTEEDVPLLQFVTRIPPTSDISAPGIQFTDKQPGNSSNPPLLYLSIYFKESRYFGEHVPSENEKWLYIEANMRFAFNLRIQVRAWNDRDVFELMRFLRNERDAYNLQGPRPSESHAGDYLHVGRERDENRLIMSTFTSTNSGISIHARFTNNLAQALTEYLEEVHFSAPFNELAG